MWRALRVIIPISNLSFWPLTTAMPSSHAIYWPLPPPDLNPCNDDHWSVLHYYSPEPSWSLVATKMTFYAKLELIIMHKTVQYDPQKNPVRIWLIRQMVSFPITECVHTSHRSLFSRSNRVAVPTSRLFPKSWNKAESLERRVL